MSEYLQPNLFCFNLDRTIYVDSPIQSRSIRIGLADETVGLSNDRKLHLFLEKQGTYCRMVFSSKLNYTNHSCDLTKIQVLL